MVLAVTEPLSKLIVFLAFGMQLSHGLRVAAKVSPAVELRVPLMVVTFETYTWMLEGHAIDPLRALSSYTANVTDPNDLSRGNVTFSQSAGSRD